MKPFVPFALPPRRRCNGVTYVPVVAGVPVDDGGFISPPAVTVEPTGTVKLKGKKAASAAGKFIYDIGPPVAGQTYTMRYTPDWSQLANGGVTAMVGFGLKQGNDFRLSGLKGDGASGLNGHEVYGTNFNSPGGYTEIDGGVAENGTQAGPNYLQFSVSPDGLLYRVRSSSDGVTWDDEFNGVVPDPLAQVEGTSTFGVAVFLQAADAGDFTVRVELWQQSVAVDDPFWDWVVLLVGGHGVDGSATFTDESQSAHTITAQGNVQVDTAFSKFGEGAALFDGSGDRLLVQGSPLEDFAFDGEFCFECWHRSNRGGVSIDYMFGRWSNLLSTCAFYIHYFWLSATQKRYTFVCDADLNGTTSSSPEQISLSQADTNINQSVAHHVVVDRDASNKIRLFVDGVMVASTTVFTTPIRFANFPLYLGSRDNSASSAGWMEEWRITKRSRYGSDSSFTPPTAKYPRTGIHNRTPVILSPSTFNIGNGLTLRCPLYADQSATWSIIGGADQSKFEISGNYLRWASDGTKSFASPDDADTNNVYVVTIRATNANGHTSAKTISVTVTATQAYATLDGTQTNVTMSGGNLTATHSNTSTAEAVSATSKRKGKFYFEATATDLDGSSDCVGLRPNFSGVASLPSSSAGYVAHFVRNSGQMWVSGSVAGSLGTPADGSRIDVAVDLDNLRIWFRINGGNWNNSGTANPATNVGGHSITGMTWHDMVPGVGFGGTGTQAGDNWTVNFGASAWAGTPPSGFRGWEIN